jgi:hypothetical protein
LPESVRFARRVFFAGALAALLITIGPYIPLERGYWRDWQTPSATSHLPSVPWLMFHLAPVFRFFTRAFVLVSACLAVLAAIGFARLERSRRMTPAGRGALAAVVLALLAVEFTNAPPHVWYSAKRPPWVRAVHKLPPRAKLIDYPMAPAFSPRSLYYMFWQTKHGRADANPQVTPEAQSLAAVAGSPDDPATGEALHRAGIDYAVVHTRLPPQTTVPYQPQLPNDSMPLDAGEINPWFKLAVRTPDAVVYRVLATPRNSSGSRVRAGDGFGPPEAEGRLVARWLERRTGALTLFVTGKSRPLRLAFTLSSFAQPRRVTLSLDGRFVSAFEVAPGSYATSVVSLGSITPRRHSIELATAPGPQSIQKTTGAPDQRSVSVRIREPVVVLEQSGRR